MCFLTILATLYMPYARAYYRETLKHPAPLTPLTPSPGAGGGGGGGKKDI